MKKKDGESHRSLSVCKWAALAGLVLIACLYVPVARQFSWFKSESHDVERLVNEARRLGGNAYVLGRDYSAKNFHVTLDLSNTNVSDDEFARLARLPAFLHLRVISLTGTRITDKSLQLLENHESLVHLVLSETNISDEGMASIAKIPWIIDLDVSHTQISDRGVDILAENSNPMRLRGIDLRGTDVTKARACELSSSFYPLLEVDHPAVSGR